MKLLILSLFTLATLLLMAKPALASPLNVSPVDETVELAFDFRQVEAPSLLERFLMLIRVRKKSEDKGKVEKVEILDSQGNIVDIPHEVIFDNEEKAHVTLKPQVFGKPGRYTVQTTYTKEGKTTTKTTRQQDFAWGVLAINTNKSIYLPKEQALIAIAVLDERGRTVCDAKLALAITDPRGIATYLKTEDGQILVNNPECQAYEVNDKPDYFTTYQVGGPGNYKMALTAQTKNGSFTIEDSFEVKESVPFDVERVLATRIYPPKVYPVRLNITFNQDFQGQIVETVPEEFNISQIRPIGNGQKEIVWDVKARTGETITLSYSFDAPDQTPQFYLLGPLQFGGLDQLVLFEEARGWQLASDTLSLIQTANGVTNGGTTVTNTAFPTGATANNLLIAICGNRDSGAWTAPTGYSTAIEQGANTPGQGIFFKVAAGGETQATCTNATSTRLGIHLYEYSNLTTTSPLDATGSNAGTSNTPASGSVTTTVNKDLLIAGFTINEDTTFTDTTWSDADGFTERNDFPNAGAPASRSTYAGGDRLDEPAAGTYSVTVGTGASAAWRGQIAAFKHATITISGNAYADEAAIPTVWVPCDGATNNISLSINGAAKVSTNCADATGAFSFASQIVSTGDVITVFMDTNGGDKGVLYTKTVNESSNITGLTLTRNRVWIQSESASSVTNSNINTFDQTQDTDIPAASDGVALTVDSGVEIHINTGDTFAPGGAVTVDNLHIKGTYSGGTETLTLRAAGTGACTAEPGTIRPLCIDGGTFTPSSNTTKFQATSATTIEGTTYNNLTFDPTITAAVTYTGGAAITVNGSLDINPSAATAQTLTFNLGGTTTVAASGTTTIRGSGVGPASSVLNTTSAGNFALTSGKIDIQSGGTLTANGSTITLNATTSTLFTRTGTFNAGTSTVVMNPDATVTLTSGTVTFYNLSLTPTITAARTYTLGTGALTIDNNFTINPGTAANLLTVNMGAAITVSGTTTITRTTSATSNLDTTASNFALTSGKIDIQGGGTLTANGSTVIVTSSGAGASRPFIETGTFTPGTSTLRYTGTTATDVETNVTYNILQLQPGSGSPTYTLGTAASQTITTNDALTIGDGTNAVTVTAETNDPTLDVLGNFTISAAGTFTASSTGTFSVGGNWSNSGTFTAGTGTVTFDATATGKTLSATMTGASGRFYNITFNGSGGGWTFNAAAEVTNNFSLALGTVTAPSGNLTISGNFTKTGGTFTHNSGTIVFNDSSKISTITSNANITFNNITSTTAGKTLQFDAQSAGSPVITIAGTFTITGVSGNRIHIHSDLAGAQWLANFSSTQSSVTYAHIEDSGCAAGTANVNLDETSVNGGNNGSCWVFVEEPITIQGGVELRGGTTIGE